MIDLKSFVRLRKQGKDLILSTSKGLSRNLENEFDVSVLNLSKSDKEKFTSKVIEIVNSDDVLDELSQSIGQPNDEETEDEFVNRAKSTLRNILTKKFMK